MAKFQIYTYMFRPVTENQPEIPFEEFRAVDVQESLNHKQELTGACLDDQEKLKFEFNGMEYDHRTYIRQGGIYVMRIANNGHRPAKVENHFQIAELENHPSSLAIIDNRKDRQVIAIERNAAFGKDPALYAIIQETLRKALAPRRLTVDVAPKFHTAEFWQVWETSMKLKGIEYVDFPFAYPNLPAISDMVGEYMTEIARRTNSEPTLHLQGQNRESVKLDPADVWLLGAIKACAASGRPILIKPRGTEVRKIGIESPVLEELPDAVLKELDEKDLFDSRFQLIVEFLNAIKLVYE